eukprot:scaffold91142_cov38-Prasinocladus_malaysianus.AAC.1
MTGRTSTSTCSRTDISVAPGPAGHPYGTSLVAAVAVLQANISMRPRHASSVLRLILKVPAEAFTGRKYQTLR